MKVLPSSSAVSKNCLRAAMVGTAWLITCFSFVFMFVLEEYIFAVNIKSFT